MSRPIRNAPPSALELLGTILLLLLLVLVWTTAGCLRPLDSGDGIGAIGSGITYTVGPGKQYPDLKAVAPVLAQGNIVQVFPGASAYAGGIIFDKAGTAANPITIVGVRENGLRPKITGGSNGIEFRADHYVFQGFEVTGATTRCIYHHADDVTIRDTVVHDCPGHGILGAETDSGSLTLDYVEVYRCGSGTTRHPIYADSDPQAHPGSVFRMQHCYMHDQLGGNGVKSRAERNELYYNWFEGGYYREIELIGHSYSTHPRQDSDIVGNVFVKTQGSNVARFGGDGDADTSGRYRFAYNTVILRAASNAAVFQLFDRVETLEVHDSVFFKIGGGPNPITNEADVTWVSGRQISGVSNWVPNGTTIPSTWNTTIFGVDPMFVGASDYRPGAGSPLLSAASTGSSPIGFPFPLPLAEPLNYPPLRTLEAVDSSTYRLSAHDVGAFEVSVAGPDMRDMDIPDLRDMAYYDIACNGCNPPDLSHVDACGM